VGLRRVIEEKPFEEQGVVRPAFWDGFSLDTIRLDVVVTGLWIMIYWCFHDELERVLGGTDAVGEKSALVSS
jgi:hypothetical protein